MTLFRSVPSYGSVTLSPTLAAAATKASVGREMSLDGPSRAPSGQPPRAFKRHEVSLDGVFIDKLPSQARASTAGTRSVPKASSAAHPLKASWTEPADWSEFGKALGGSSVVDSAEHYAGPQEVIVRLDGSGRLGVQFVGPENHHQVGTFITEVVPGSVASKDGVLQPGMLIHAINHIGCLAKSKVEVIDLLSRSIGGGQNAVLFKVEMRQKDLEAQYGVSAGTEAPPQQTDSLSDNPDVVTSSGAARAAANLTV